MASRRSHAPTNDQQIEYELRVPRSGTYIMKPTASCEAAPLWASDSPLFILFREAGQTHKVKGICNMPIEMAMPYIEY